MKNMLYHFPKSKFAKTNTIQEQVLHTLSEAREARAAAAVFDGCSVDHLAEEIMDTYHSAETGLRILQEEYGVDIQDLMHRVAKKNERRGYYSADN